ncbi:class 1b ribonucleoside-diphosphate reductase subunit alpha [Lactobacillus crispatus]|jgi:ribonucleoside-diphosphate reductase, alpha subunit|uniref:Ribonucleoside-diphosphate reductase n=3 Tax=Lactobacillus crispatus TaxID=47770 RepID=A0ABV2BB97_9LACO|nr:class 1b ribonucleoside-diphosphate reductase subunit alpha [Lactobacillus crispatus]EEU28558.1 ribonucleoside-diphosphate reductase, alpha subunit [Lactobacillus crispatus MV-1A-US]EEX30009.1 ribonucleoside-diphosphate reductase, alpha subunit [Lactobacillus crispatus MV-3A-US]KXI18148.1 ribonucleoside-diphosphate reductase, alpha subunit [Lactobacillus crispatus]MCT7711425.1 class 1b ribonucleoside-diphosphate reductase subunit alpha [Lactobacillus crispatus]MCT7713531.1 class 1b ribonucl
MTDNLNNDSYISLNALAKFKDEKGNYNFKADKEATKQYLENHIEPRMKKFASLEEKLAYLVDNDYYDKKVLDLYTAKFIKEIFKLAYAQNFSFLNFMGAAKFYKAYALKTNDNKQFLERFEDRAVMNALFLADGNEELALNLVKDIISNRFQPATPTFLNAGKKRRGEYISCYLLRVEDNMESISRAISTSLQLSKRGGGVALCLTNLRELGAPIKKMKNLSSGIIPVMKLLEDSFSYANQLGQRQGAGAVYLSAHHPQIMQFLDTKRENADEKVRIKSLSLGVVIPDITFELAKENKKMALFSPYDIKREYGKPMSDISITKEYQNLLNNPRIKKTFISARKFFQTIAEVQFESGYPYIMYEDTVNRRNPQKKLGRIVMSNLCSEIAQVNTPSTYNKDLSFNKTGYDVCCNLGSLNIAAAMNSADKLGDLVSDSVQALNRVARSSDLDCAPSIEKGNKANRAIGLGAMNLHGFLATNHIYYDSPEAVEFTGIFFYTIAYHAFKESNKLAETYGAFKGFKDSSYASGDYFKKFIDEDVSPKTDKIKEIVAKYKLVIPTKEDWEELITKIKKTGIANANLLAVAPTGSISYLSSCTPSLQPVVAPVETRKEADLGRIYVPAYKINKDNYEYYEKGAYEVGPNAIIDITAAAQKYVDQSISLTLFVEDNATTRDLNKAYIYAFKKRCNSIYYVRIREKVLAGSENLTADECLIQNGAECQKCMI